MATIETRGPEGRDARPAAYAPVPAALAEHLVQYEGVLDAVDLRTIEILRRRRIRGWNRRRGWLVRRLLLLSDVLGLALAFLVTQPFPSLPFGAQLLVLAGSLPVWIVAAKVFGLYDSDDVRTDHSTVDDLVGVFELITSGAWAFVVVPWSFGLTGPDPGGAVGFWLLAVAMGFAVSTSLRVHRAN